MGMYTEISVKLKLKRGLPTGVIYALKFMTSYQKDDAIEFMLPHHPLFKTERWHLLLQEDSLVGVNLISRSKLKNYHEEIGLFFNWIKPYVKSCEDGVMGYSKYEEDENKTYFYLK